MSILAAILLAVSGLVCAPVAWGTQALIVWQVRLLAALGTVLALAACLLGLVSGEHAPAWLAAPAAVIAAATRSPAVRPRVSANAVGPLPEIELPSAPAASAAALASAKPGRSPVRAGSAIRSSMARPRSS